MSSAALQILKRRRLDWLRADPTLAVSDAPAKAADLAARLTPEGRWPDVNYACQELIGWRTSEHLRRLLALAHARAVAGEPFREPALSALEGWLRDDFRSSNWWWNQIGTPGSLAQSALLLEDDMGADSRAQIRSILARAEWETRMGERVFRWKGANLAWMAGVILDHGLFAENATFVGESFAQMYAEVRVMDPGQEGLQADGSFQFHGPLLYSGGYGLAFTDEVGRFICLAQDTEYAVPPAVWEVFLTHVLDGQRWMARGGTLDYGTLGREISRKGRNVRRFVHAVSELGRLPLPRQDELRQFAARLAEIPGVPAWTGNRHFWRSDFMAHHRPGFYTSVRMASQRVLCGESIAGEGLRSHHLADGVNFHLHDGSEYRDSFPFWNWRRPPGATCLQRDEWEPPAEVAVHGATPFAGGASDGEYGVAAMDLERGALKARKAWFFFDAGWICLGAGITAQDPAPVFTTLDQCWLRGPVRSAGRPDPWAPGLHTLEQPAWLYHNGCAYFFLQPARIGLECGPRTGSWRAINTQYNPEELTGALFCAWVDHGLNPRDAAYAYAVLPGVTPETLNDPRRPPPYVVLSNTAYCQAAGAPAEAVWGAIFRGPGALQVPDLGRVAVHTPCLILLRVSAASLTVALADPLQQAAALRVDFEALLEGEGAEQNAGTTSLEIPLLSGRLAGASVIRHLRRA